jgi:hypothetical protein
MNNQISTASEAQDNSYFESESSEDEALLYTDAFTLEDEWDCSGGDFTKKYNRMKAQITTLTQSRVLKDTVAVKGQILNQLNQVKNKEVKDLSEKYSSRIKHGKSVLIRPTI